MQHNTSKFDLKKISGLVGLVVLACVFRFIPHPPNLSPILALMVIAGASGINPLISLAIALMGIFGTDLYFGVYDGMSMTYVAYIWAFFIGRITAQPKWQFVVFGGSLSSAVFFLLSNYGVWAFTAMYPKTTVGLIDCFLMALPFFHYTVLSTVGFLLGVTITEKAFAVLKQKTNA